MTDAEIDGFNRIDLNNYSLIEPSPAVVDIFQKYWKPFDPTGDRIQYYLKPEGMRLQIWELMKIYGPLFREDLGNPPFERISLSLSSFLSEKPPVYREIKVTDFIYFVITEQGTQRLTTAFPGRNAARTPNVLTSMQFFHAAYFLEPECRMGGNIQFAKYNQLYLPGK